MDRRSIMFEKMEKEELLMIEGGYWGLIIAAAGLGIAAGKAAYDAGYAWGQREAYRVKNSA